MEKSNTGRNVTPGTRFPS